MKKPPAQENKPVDHPIPQEGNVPAANEDNNKEKENVQKSTTPTPISITPEISASDTLTPTPTPDSASIKMENNQEEVPEKKKRKQKKEKTARHERRKRHTSLRWLMFPISIFIFFSFSIAVVSALIVYDIVPLNNKAIKQRLTSFVMQIPFAPVSSRHLILSTIASHKEISTTNFSMDLRMSVPEIQQSLSFSSLNTKANGFVDLSKEMPVIDLSVVLDEQFSTEIQYKEHYLYINPKTVPQFIREFLKTEDTVSLSTLTNVWIKSEQQNLRANIKAVLRLLSSLDSDEEVLSYLSSISNVSKVRSDTLSGYKLAIVLDKVGLSELSSNLSKIANKNDIFYSSSVIDNMENLTLEIYIDSSNNSISNISIATKLLPKVLNPVFNKLNSAGFIELTEAATPVDVSINLVFSNYNEEMQYEEPEKTITYKTFVNQIERVYRMNNATADMFPNEHAIIVSIIQSLWELNGTAPKTTKEVENVYSYPLVFHNIQYAESMDYVVVYGLNPNPEDSSKPYYASTIKSPTEVESQSFSMEELKRYIADLDLIFKSINVGETPTDEIIDDESKENTEAEEDPGNPFGKLLN